MTFMNRVGTSQNMYQGKTKRVLCVCSAGILRSPTSAHILSAEPFNFNTRAAGASEEFALIPLDKVLIGWADVIICMEDEHLLKVTKLMDEMTSDTAHIEVYNVHCPDLYSYRDPDLVRYLTDTFTQIFNKETHVHTE